MEGDLVVGGLFVVTGLAGDDAEGWGGGFMILVLLLLLMVPMGGKWAVVEDDEMCVLMLWLMTGWMRGFG